MKEFNILWIDDDWEHMNNTEFLILDEIRTKLLSYDSRLNIVTKSSIADGVMSILGRDIRYDFVIIDLDFKNENEKSEKDKYNYSDLVDQIQNKGIKYAILSNQKVNFNLSETVAKTKNLIIGIYDKGNYAKFIGDMQNISRFSPLNILHISDFHYDSTMEGNEAIEQEDRFEKLIKIASEMHKKEMIDYVIFSGDLAYKKPDQDLKICGKFIRKLINSTINDYSKIFIIPGNHDIEWDNYEQSKISAIPANSFYEFYKEVFDDNLDFISRLIGYNSRNDSFDNNCNPDSFCWSYTNMNNLVSILGLNSVTTSADLKSKGKISKNVISFIKKEWSRYPTKHELRIAVFHHNILPPFSINKLDESESLLNSGEILELLSELNCDILLSGHCHDSYLYNFSFSSLNYNGFNNFKNITYISTGTFGGVTPTLDRARSFNMIKVYQSKDEHTKTIRLSPIVYDSRRKEWIKQKELHTDIHQNH